MAAPAHIRITYGALATTLTPALRLWLERRATRGKEDPFRLRERFGHASQPRPEGMLVWLHAASVGELQSVLVLMCELLAQRTDLSLLITTGTVTSAALMAQQNLPRTIHQFVPIDTPQAVSRFLDHWHPNAALWVESELWPNLIWQAQAHRIPMLLVNARMSEKSLNGWQRWPRTVRSMLSGFAAIYAGSAPDAERLRALGATQVQDVGNLKYDADPLPVDAKLVGELAAACAGRRVLVAASTHADEEQMLAETHAHVAQQFPTLLTIIIPRHAVRGDAIAADLRARGHTVAQRSKGEAILPTTTIYLADTMGELGSFYQQAELVFMGGSLIAHGGQNPLEAARAAKPILTGPHTHNFAAIVHHLMQHDAIRIVLNVPLLTTEIIHLLSEPDACAQLARRAQKTVQEARGASHHIRDHTMQLLQGSAV
jgi:3-deoxy-D-manno-octulosonic-acid transferase